MAPVPAEMDKLFEDAMKSRWEEVVETYKTSQEARQAKITISGETALHLAISDGETKAALQLIHIVDTKQLKIKNDDGNTALHLAAALGNLEVCKHIASKEPSLDIIKARNNNDESPIFLAALHGKKETFLWLHSLNQDEMHLRRNDGDTILHVAIDGDYFSLAINIARYHPVFVNSLNIHGLSPLHILASKTNAFRSSTSLGLFDRILYDCLVVDELEEPQISIEAYRKSTSGTQTTSTQKCPPNYQSCMNLLLLPKMMTPTQTKKLENKKGQFVRKGNASADVENPEQHSLGRDNEKKKASKNITSELQIISPLQVSILSQGLKIPKRVEDKDRFFPPNYHSIVLLFKLMMKVLLIVLGIGFSRIKEMRSKKELHMRANLLMELLVKHTHYYKSYGNTGLRPGTESGYPEQSSNYEEIQAQMMIGSQPSIPDPSKDQKGSDQSKLVTHQTPILIAAKTGVTEMVEKILEEYPVAMQDLNSEGKNVVLLAVENRQPLVYNLLLKRKILKENVFRQVDSSGNSALHLAAQLGKHKPWLIPGSALQMQWEIKWYEYVKNSMPPNFFPVYNKDGESPNDVFVRTHDTLIKDGSDWLAKTSESCSVVAALVATVAFTTSSAVPGGVKSESGTPTLEDKPAFDAFAISALIALCFSITALVFFLSILTSRYQEKDFAADLPRKLLLGLTSLFASIAAMLVSFCAGHVFVLDRDLRIVAYPLYAALCFPITFFGLAQLSLYFDLIMAIIKNVPQRSHRMFPH